LIIVVTAVIKNPTKIVVYPKPLSPQYLPLNAPADTSLHGLALAAGADVK
jgi:hypothetical protein